MTLTIKRINFTALLDAQVTAACRHAEHASTPVVANQLYEIAEDLNRVVANIQKRGLGPILDGPLPTGRPVAQDDADDIEPDIAPDAPIAAAPTRLVASSPLRNAAPKAAQTPTKPLTQRQRILSHIQEHPGCTATQIAHALGIKQAIAGSECKQLRDIGRIRAEGSRPAHYFPVHPTPPTAQAADTTRAPAIPA